MVYLLAWLFLLPTHATVNAFDFESIRRGRVPALQYALDLHPSISPERAAAFFIELAEIDPSLAFRLVSGQTYLRADDRFSSLLVRHMVSGAENIGELLRQLDHVRKINTARADLLAPHLYRQMWNTAERFDLNIHLALHDRLSEASPPDLKHFINQAANVETQLSPTFRERLELATRAALKVNNNSFGRIARYKTCAQPLRF